MFFLWFYREACKYHALNGGTMDGVYWTDDPFINSLNYTPPPSFMNYKRFSDMKKKTGFEPEKMLELWHADDEIFQEYAIHTVTTILDM
jgi:hypothetical protein